MKKYRSFPARIVEYALLVQVWLWVVTPPLRAQDSAFQSIEETEDEEDAAPAEDAQPLVADAANEAEDGASAEGAAQAEADAAGDAAIKVAKANGWNIAFGIVEAQLTNGLLHGGVRLAVRGYADSTLESIYANLTNPWELDQSRYRTNMLGHPYQGVFYFQAARSNNWHFYASLANAVLGSAVWEIFCEPARGSINDIITTPLAGTVYGEALHRLYYSAESLSGVMPAILRFFISPFDFLNRYIPGGNPPAKPTGELWQLDASAGLFFGVQSRVNPSNEGVGNAIAPGASLALNAVYGNPFTTYVPWSDPFRSFELIIAVDGSYPVYQVGILAHGMLYSMPYATESTEGVAGLSLHYDTLWGANVSFGGTSLDFTLTNRRPLGFGNLDFKLHAGALLFGSANTFDAKQDLSGWDDEEIQVYGSGANLKFSIGINDTPAGDFGFSSAFFFMPLYYDKAGYADWGDMVFFWNPSLNWIFRLTRRVTLSASFSDALCVEFLNKRQDIIENTAVIRIAAGYRFRSEEKR